MYRHASRQTFSLFLVKNIIIITEVKREGNLRRHKYITFTRAYLTRYKTHEYAIESLYRLKTGNIREAINDAGKYDVIMLGAFGQFFGDYYTTHNVSEHLLEEK